MADPVDWFVAPTSATDGTCLREPGNGSRERPFHDPWLAFRRAEPGDLIHIAAGTYFGRFDRSSWLIEAPRLTVLGGYSADFATRTPWATPSVFACYPGYEAARENNLIAGREDHSDLVLDGLCFDAAGRNRYGEKPGDGIGWMSPMDGAIASFSAPGVTIRHCVFMNSAQGAVDLQGSGSRFENNLVVNTIGIAMLTLRSATQLIDKPITVSGNTFAFMHDMGEPAGTGGDRSQGVRVQCPAVLENNVFFSCGNSAVGLLLDPGRVAIERNVFFAAPHSLVEYRQGATTSEIREKNLEELEDLGFKACAGNAVKDPAFGGMPERWLDGYSRDLLARYKTPPRDAINALRASAGLPMLTPADLQGSPGADSGEHKSKGETAAPWTTAQMSAFTVGAKQGAHPVDTPVTMTGRAAPALGGYQRIEWPAMVTADLALNGQRVELRVGMGTEQNTQLLADATSETHMGVRVYNPGSDDNSLFVLIPRHSFPARQFRETRTYQRGREVESTYLLRGVYRGDVKSSFQKATLIVESIERGPVFAPPLPVRPSGRDWFVRAGSSGGDGSREKPFRDPFQALEKCEGGDTIHVAAGEYFGKLRSGKWLITMRNLALLGGYDPEFTARDPWTHHTRFSLDAEEKAKGRPGGTPLYSEENSDGLIVDGFIFDGASWNTYQDGSLDLKTSPLAPLVRLRGADAPVTVRNCLFVNASDGAVVLDSALAVFENNVIVNTSSDALVVNAMGTGPAIIRNNTVLFACDPTERAGTGQSSSRGTLVQLTSRGNFVVQSNLFALADNYGMRASLPQENVELTDNVFAANGFNHLCDAKYLWADDSNWARRVEADSAFALRGNALELPSLPVDPEFADLVLARLFALPTRIAADHWKRIAAAVGAKVRPAEAQPAAAPPPPPPAPSGGGSSLSDLMSRLGGAMDKLKEAEAASAPAAQAPRYCPRYDYVKALALFTEGSGPGAHRRKLEVSFASSQAKAQLSYTAINAAELDEKRDSLNLQPIELLITRPRDSSSNPSVFAPGTDKKDYSAYGVEAVEAQTRVRIAMVIRDDTDLSRRMGKVAATDKLRVRGVAHHTSGASGLTLVVDSFEVV